VGRMGCGASECGALWGEQRRALEHDELRVLFQP